MILGFIQLFAIFIMIGIVIWYADKQYKKNNDLFDNYNKDHDDDMED